MCSRVGSGFPTRTGGQESGRRVGGTSGLLSSGSHCFPPLRPPDASSGADMSPPPLLCPPPPPLLFSKTCFLSWGDCSSLSPSGTECAALGRARGATEGVLPQVRDVDFMPWGRVNLVFGFFFSCWGLVSVVHFTRNLFWLQATLYLSHHRCTCRITPTPLLRTLLPAAGDVHPGELLSLEIKRVHLLHI